MSTKIKQVNRFMRYHVGIGCSFGASEHNVHQLLAKKQRAQFIDLSKPGGGNFRIYTELLYWVSANKHRIKNTTFSIGWSGIYRNDMIEKHGGEKNAFEWTRWRADRDDPTHKNLPSSVDIKIDQTIRFLSYVLATQNLLKKFQCNYIMYNGIDTYMDRSVFDVDTALRMKILEKQIDMDTFYEFTGSQLKFIADNKYFKDPRPAKLIRNIINWPTDDTQYAVKDAHPSPEGDKEWAELIWQFCKKNQIL